MVNPFAAAFSGLVTLALVAELGLAGYVMARLRHEWTARLAAAYLVVHALSLAPLFVLAFLDTLVWERFAASHPSITSFSHFFAALGIAFLSAIDIAFALSFPNLHPRLRGERVWLLLPFLLPIISLFFTMSLWLARAAIAPNEYIRLGPKLLFLPEPQLEVLILVDTAWLLVGLWTVALTLSRRAKRAGTELERRRLLYMLHFLTIPVVSVFLVGLLVPIVALLPLVQVVDLSAVVFRFDLAVLGTLVLIPGVGWSLGILRYRIFDVNDRLRKGLRLSLGGGVFTAILVTVFFLASELAETVLTVSTNSHVLALFAAALVSLAAYPLRRGAARILRRAVPPESPLKRPQRRLDVYRATFEDLAPNGRPSSEERRALKSVANSLGLTSAQTKAVEDQVLAEREERLAATGTLRPPALARRGVGRQEGKPWKASFVACATVFAILFVIQSAAFAWDEAVADDGFTAERGLNLAWKKSFQRDSDARLVGIIGTEGDYDLAWMPPLTGDLLGPDPRCGDVAVCTWNDLDEIRGDGKTLMWSYFFFLPSRNKTYGVQVSDEGSVSRTSFHRGPSSAVEPLTLTVDSDEAVRTALALDSSFSSALSGKDARLLLVLRSAPTAGGAQWTLTAGGAGLSAASVQVAG